MKIIAIIQARTESKRLPNKVMRKICNTPMIGLLLDRLSLAKKINKIIIATPNTAHNQILVDYIKCLGFSVYSGSDQDVLDRYYHAAQQTNADIIVRITGDCPLIDPELVDETIMKHLETNVDYTSNVEPPTFPDGLDIEVFSFSALKKAYQEATKPEEREHVTRYIRQSPDFTKSNYSFSKDYSSLRWTVDEWEDFQVIQKVFEYFYPRHDFSWLEVLELETQHPEFFAPNKLIQRNEGMHMNTGQKLWRRAKQIIPGGNMLLSKRSEMFLPNLWPSYYSKAKGCTVWDLDGNAYIDMSIMGIGTNILGYGHPDVDAAVYEAIQAGNMSTLNCPEEVYLAERLIALHPWADMVRFARSGGEANAIAIRIARAASGKDKIAFCGYHGWHDWYLAANLADEKTLAGHLLPGLEPHGVPQNLSHTIFPFNYNRFDELQDLVDHHDIGVIMMEVSRNEGPEAGFLNNVRKLATEKGIVLIFDECTSGFRQTFGGLHSLYGIEPDMAMFGKALGNGYAITAAIGRREVMEAAQTSFISSTFWSERIGPSAALKTLDIMEQTQSWNIITATGKNIRLGWQRIADQYDLKIKLWGLPALSGFTFESQNALSYKTFITQEMLSRGFLAANSVYTCIEHTPDIIDQYFIAIEPIFERIAECENGRDISTLLKSDICHNGFKRLN